MGKEKKGERRSRTAEEKEEVRIQSRYNLFLFLLGISTSERTFHLEVTRVTRSRGRDGRDTILHALNLMKLLQEGSRRTDENHTGQ